MFAVQYSKCYADRGPIGGTAEYSYVTTILGTTHGGFIPIATGGSATIYYCGYGNVGSSGIISFGCD